MENSGYLLSRMNVTVELAGFYRNTILSDLLNKSFVQFDSLVLPGGMDKRWSPAFFTVTKQGKLGDNEHLTTDREQRAVQFTVFIFKDSQVYNFIRKVIGIIGIIWLCNT